jgi:hypothetical protein
LHPRPEIILFGDEEGVAEICVELGLRHVPEIARNEFRTPLLNDIFQKGNKISTNDILCYINADIILMSDFMPAIQKIISWNKQFLIVGQRWDLDLTESVDFTNNRWEEFIRSKAKKEGKLHPPTGADYFVFPKGFFLDIPPFGIGRTTFDNWMIERAITLKIPVVNISQAVMAIHQNHDYSHHPLGKKGVWEGKETHYNRSLAGIWTRSYNISDATYRFDGFTIRRNLIVPWIRNLKRRKNRILKWFLSSIRLLWKKLLMESRHKLDE